MNLAISHYDTANWRSLLSNSGTSYGVGDESKQLLVEILELNEHAQQSISLGAQSRIDNQIEDLKATCGDSGWDGYDADPISDDAVETAKLFNRLLPDNIIEPEITPEATGTISFDWNKGKNFIFSISILPDTLVYAGIIGGEKIHGNIPLSKRLPDVIQKSLTMFFSRAI